MEQTFVLFMGAPINMKNPGKIQMHSSIDFHQLDPDACRREKWSEACRMVNLVNKDSMVCSDHFEPHHYPTATKCAELSSVDAVPSIPARSDNAVRFSKGEVIYPMIEDWGPPLCRLCAKPVLLMAETERTGVHIFGAEAQEMNLLQKINMYLPQPDSLPKFVCRLCVTRVDNTVATLLDFRLADKRLRDELGAKGSLKDLEAEGNHARRTHSPQGFKCHSCEHLFRDLPSLLLHELDHAKPPTQASALNKSQAVLPIPCSQCAQRFLSPQSLSLHLSSVHGQKSASDDAVFQCLDSRENKEFRFDLSHELCHVPSVESEDDRGNNEVEERPFSPPRTRQKSKLKSSQPSKKEVKTRTELTVGTELNLKNEPTDFAYIKVPTLETIQVSYECSDCSEVFTEIQTFKKHMKVHTAERKKQLCSHCNKYFTPAGLKTHQQRIRLNNEYICDLCKKVFKDRHYLVMHIKNTHNPNRLQCSKCTRTFKSKEGLQGHLMRHEGIYSFLCDICGISFLTQSAMRIHRRKHTQQNFFTCEYCGKKIQEHNRYQDHLRKHTGETPFGCERCERKFHSKKLLKQHMQIHNDVRPHQCPKCNMSFKRVGNLKQHLERHTTYRPICSICRASFSCCEERNAHRRTHTKEEREQAKIARSQPKGPKRNRNQYLCKACTTIFTTKEEKAEHLAQNPSHVNSIKCGMCELTFRSYQSLSVHQRIHTGERPYSCNVCLKTFRTYATCRQHTLIHSEEMKFKCEQCDRSFNRLYTLNVHRRSHSNERPFECPTCGRGFKQKQDMKKHLRLHAAKDSSQFVEEKWDVVIEEELIQAPSLCDTITIPADMQDLQYGGSNLLATSNIVITVPYMHSTTDAQAFFSM
ncbi:hypothetical protein B566_EDAN015665 [Ephemera danica]|nr:hypothetical protein B566_EDAN015665 [Ephemera danica]